ncbi:MAG TPA: hypothetical protein VGF14_05790 [Alphaproteobacteria bacterium]
MTKSALKLFLTAGLAIGWPGKTSTEDTSNQQLQAASTTSISFTQPLSYEDSLRSARLLEPVAPFPNLKISQYFVPGMDASIVMNANTKQILCGHNIHEPRIMASMAKPMVLYIIAEELEAGRLHLKDKVKIRQTNIDYHEPYGLVTLGLTPEDDIDVEGLIRGIAVASAADASDAAAYTITPVPSATNPGEIDVAASIAAFVVRMKETAQELNMHNTNYVNTHGGPVRRYNSKNKPLPFEEQNYTTVYNMALMLYNIKDRFPFMAEMMKTKSFYYDSGLKEPHTYKNWAVKAGAEYGKTGFIRESQYNVMGYRDDIIAVTMGHPTVPSRAKILSTLFNYGKEIILKMPEIELPPAPVSTPVLESDEITIVAPGTIRSMIEPLKSLDNTFYTPIVPLAPLHNDHTKKQKASLYTPLKNRPYTIN